MPDFTALYPVLETAQYDFSHGLLNFCNFPARLVAPTLAKACCIRHAALCLLLLPRSSATRPLRAAKNMCLFARTIDSGGGQLSHRPNRELRLV
jgi:hypothetical protein